MKGLNDSNERFSGQNMSELEVDERLDGCALHLNDEPDCSDKQQCLAKKRQPRHEVVEAVHPSVGGVMGSVAQGHEDEYCPVSRHHLRQQMQGEVAEDLPYHVESHQHVALAEEDPAETGEVERQQDSRHLAPAGACVVLVTTEETAEALVQGEGNTMHGAPQHEIP